MTDIFDKVSVGRNFRGSFCKKGKEPPDTPAFRNESQVENKIDALCKLTKRDFENMEGRTSKLEFIQEMINSNKNSSNKKEIKSK